MRRLLWVVAWVAVALWSLFAWGAHGLLDFFGGVAVRNADLVSNHPETVEWLSWAFATLRSLGLGAIVFVWAVGSLLILAVPAVLGRMFSRSHPVSSYPHWQPTDRGSDEPPPFRVPPRQIERR